MPVLQAFGGRPSVVNPMLAGATHRKTDVLDARMLAKQSMTNTWPRSFIPSAEAQILRVLWNQRKEYARAATRAFNRINNIVLRFGHTFGSSVPCRSSEGLALLDALISGAIVNHPGMKPETLPWHVRPTLKKLLQEGEEAIAQTKLAAAYAVQYASIKRWPIDGGRWAEGKELLDLLQTVPGVGINTAMVWLAEVTNPTRFNNSKQVAAYCGCDPSLKVSAGKVTQHVRRKGNIKLHEALIQCATSVLARGATPLGEWGKAIAGKHSAGGFRKAAGAVARRIACALWHVHRKGETFSYEGYGFYKSLPGPVPHAPGLSEDHKTYVIDKEAKVMQPKQKTDENNDTKQIKRIDGEPGQPNPTERSQPNKSVSKGRRAGGNAAPGRITARGNRRAKASQVNHGKKTGPK